MRIVSTYSSWCRNRITPALREAIATAGEGEVRYHAAVGHPRGYVGCEVRTPDGRGIGVGPSPESAFRAAVVGVRPVEIVRLVG